jgi:hypothetical protein
MAEVVPTIHKCFRRILAEITSTDQFGFIGKIYGFSSIECIERALPQTAISVLLTIANNSTFNLIHLIETTFFHHCGEDFAANATSTVRDNGFVLEVVVFSAI